MKYTVRGGHNKYRTGASHYVDELTEDRKIYPYVIETLKGYGHDVYDVTPSETCTYELSYGITKAKEIGADYSTSIHMNSTPGGYGVECWVNPNAPRAVIDRASTICKNIASFGFRNRGVKYSNGFAETKLRNWIIVEVCFVDSKSDTDLYRQVGAKAIGKAIGKGLVGANINTNIPNKKPSQAKIATINYTPHNYTGTITASALNVRSGAGTNYSRIGMVYQNSSFIVEKEQNGWCYGYYITYGGNKKYGWVSKQYVTK